MTAYSEITRWHRRLCPVTDGIIISGDLAEDPEQAVRQLGRWQEAGITHVLDTRSEWSDEEFVAKHAPNIVYAWVGTDDYGAAQPDSWFDDGLSFADDALSDPDAVLLVHCHMGINRGPSMAYRILLESGRDPIDALDAIRQARPIADIAYAADALDHYHRRHGITSRQRALDRDRLASWQRGHDTIGWHLIRPQD